MGVEWIHRCDNSSCGYSLVSSSTGWPFVRDKAGKMQDVHYVGSGNYSYRFCRHCNKKVMIIDSEIPNPFRDKNVKWKESPWRKKLFYRIFPFMLSMERSIEYSCDRSCPDCGGKEFRSFSNEICPQCKQGKLVFEKGPVYD